MPVQQAIEQDLDLEDVFRNPDIFPLHIDLASHAVNFVILDKKILAASPFACAKFLKGNLRFVDPIRIDDLAVAARSSRANIVSPHFIVHIAYCCSTLIARCFEYLSNCLVLKEPEILSQLSLLRGFNESSYEELLEIVNILLSRGYQDTHYVLIKPNVTFNAAVDDFLTINYRSKITYLSVSLENFLCSVLKHDWRRARVRSWMACTVQMRDSTPRPGGLELGTLSDAKVAAYWWLWNERNAARLLHAFPGRVLRVDGDAFTSQPQDQWVQIASFFEIEITSEVALMLSKKMMNDHSKDETRSFSPLDREIELNTLGYKFSKEISEATEWLNYLVLQDK